MNPADYTTWRKNWFSDQPQVRREWSGDNLIYVGIAPRGAATSEAKWIIWKLAYTGTNVTLQQTSIENVKWDDRATVVTYA